MQSLAAYVRQAGLASNTVLSIARFGPGQRLEALSQGNWPDGAAVEANDQFYVASLAKQVTGGALAILVNEGRLDPDAPISTLLADLPAWCGMITTRQLAHHVAGLPPAGQLEEMVQEHWTESTALTALAQLGGLPATPGIRYEYSNISYILLARIVSVVASQPFASFVANRLFKPYGLHGMVFASDPPSFPHAVHLGAKLPLAHGDGGLWSTASDFARWLQLLNEDAFGVAHLIEADLRVSDGSTVKYGWGQGIRMHRGHPMFVHGGEWPGAVAKAVRSRDLGFGIVAVAAATPFASLDRLVASVLDEL